MKEKMNLVPKVSVYRDPRFSIEENWKTVEENIQECQARGVLVTPLTVFAYGKIYGWYLYGWVAAPAVIMYEYNKPKEDILNYCI